MSILRNMLGYGQRPAVYSGDFSAIGGGRGGDGGAGGFLDDIDSDFEEELMAQIGEVVRARLNIFFCDIYFPACLLF